MKMLANKYVSIRIQLHIGKINLWKKLDWFNNFGLIYKQ